jgi:hypothetical protein
MEGLVSSLFNRAVLDTIVGFLFSLVLDVGIEAATGASMFERVKASNWGSSTSILIVVVSFLVGTLLDKATFLAVDRRVFQRVFLERQSSFDLPQWCTEQFSGNGKPALGKSNQGHLGVDESSADWITAVFWTRARTEALQKRSDLVANYQFISSLLVVAAFALLVIPLAAVRNREYVSAVAVALSLLGFSLFLWRACLASIRRIHTHENLVVYGILLNDLGTPVIPIASAP